MTSSFQNFSLTRFFPSEAVLVKATRKTSLVILKMSWNRFAASPSVSNVVFS